MRIITLVVNESIPVGKGGLNGVMRGMRTIIIGKNIVVGDIMTTPVVTVGPDADLGQVIGLMNKTGKRRVPVIEGDDIIGMVTASDIIRVLATMKLIADGISNHEED